MGSGEVKKKAACGWWRNKVAFRLLLALLFVGVLSISGCHSVATQPESSELMPSSAITREPIEYWLRTSMREKSVEDIQYKKVKLMLPKGYTTPRGKMQIKFANGATASTFLVQETPAQIEVEKKYIESRIDKYHGGVREDDFVVTVIRVRRGDWSGTLEIKRATAGAETDLVYTLLQPGQMMVTSIFGEIEERELRPEADAFVSELIDVLRKE